MIYKHYINTAQTSWHIKQNNIQVEYHSKLIYGTCVFDLSFGISMKWRHLANSITLQCLMTDDY